jgi:cell division protein FtsL
MARNRKNLPASIRFGPVVKALLLCLVIGGAAVGYVWQKTQIYELGKQIRNREARLAELQDANKKLRDQLAMLRSPARLEQRARELNLGLGQPLPQNIWRLPEPAALPAGSLPGSGQYAAYQSRGVGMP